MIPQMLWSDNVAKICNNVGVFYRLAWACLSKMTTEHWSRKLKLELNNYYWPQASFSALQLQLDKYNLQIYQYRPVCAE